MRDKIEEIYLRHNRVHMTPSDWWTLMGADAHQDRAFLLNKVWEMREEIERLRDQIYESIPKGQANELQREINQLRDALQFYADPKRYKSASVHMCGHSTGQSVMIDGGRKARKALEGKP